MEQLLPQVSSPEDMAKRDPLATQVWRAYARARETLPNGARMENLTWRMMHLNLKKAEDAAREAELGMEAQLSVSQEAPASAPESESAQTVTHERGRSKGKSRVVGFQDPNSPPA